MSDIATRCALAAAVAALALHSPADMNGERMSRAYQAAMADYSAGRLDAAINGFEKAVEANGNNASARFQLACLLQDYRKDWLGAMCSYREYLRLEGQSDKAPLARERMAICERELAGELAKKYSLAPTEDNDNAGEKLRQALKDAEKKAAAAESALGESQRKTAVLERENATLRRQLRSIGEDQDDARASGGNAVATARDVLSGVEDDDAPPPKIYAGAAASADDDESATGIRQGLSAAKELVEEDDSGPELLGGEQTPGPGARKLTDFAASMNDKETSQDRGGRPETYVVQEGDSLYRIARRFYGKESAWKKIRDANKATITTDGRVKTGQTIVLP